MNNIAKLPKPTKYNPSQLKKKIKTSSSQRAESSYQRMTCETTSKMK